MIFFVKFNTLIFEFWISLKICIIRFSDETVDKNEIILEYYKKFIKSRIIRLFIK